VLVLLTPSNMYQRKNNCNRLFKRNYTFIYDYIFKSKVSHHASIKNSLYNFCYFVNEKIVDTLCDFNTKADLYAF